MQIHSRQSCVFFFFYSLFSLCCVFFVFVLCSYPTLLTQHPLNQPWFESLWGHQTLALMLTLYPQTTPALTGLFSWDSGDGGFPLRSFHFIPAESCFSFTIMALSKPFKPNTLSSRRTRHKQLTKKWSQPSSPPHAFLQFL